MSLFFPVKIESVDLAQITENVVHVFPTEIARSLPRLRKKIEMNLIDVKKNQPQPAIF